MHYLVEGLKNQKKLLQIYAPKSEISDDNFLEKYNYPNLKKQVPETDLQLVIEIKSAG